MAVTRWSADNLLDAMIRFPSVSNTSNQAVTQWVTDRLEELGFQTETIEYRDAAGVNKCNVLGRRGPAGGPGLAYFSHSDVVPAENWQGPADAAGRCDPFEPVRQSGRIYGRGSCDMKGSLACMLEAASRIDGAQQQSPLTIVCTADEEVGFEGARQVARRSRLFRQLVAEQPVAVIGEPTSMQVVYAHKGIAGYRITSHGRAAHSSTREGVNANLAMVPVLVELKRLYEQSESDPALRHPDFDPPTLTWNFGVSDHATAVNITPEVSRAWVCFRPMPGVDGQPLVDQLVRCAESNGLSVEPLHGGPPIWIEPTSDCIVQMCRLARCAQPQTVCYGTDGGQFTELKQLLVLGPGDIAQAHTADEWISETQLRSGTEIYEAAIAHWCG